MRTGHARRVGMMNMLRRIAYSVSMISIATVPLVAHAQLSSTGAAEASFTAVGPAGMKIVGQTHDLTVADDAQSITVTVPLTNLTTGIALRDRHMREKYLQVGQYASAQLVVPRAALRLPASGATVDASAPATLTIHGRAHPVTIRYTARGEGKALHVSGGTHIDIRDYGIDVPSYLGVTVKPDIDVAVRFDALDK
jgi:polyisoprenoid-binding protein YceI